MWTNILIGYGIATLLVFLVASLFASESSIIQQDRRTAARVAIASPLWPAVLLWALWASVRGVWRQADLGGKR